MSCICSATLLTTVAESVLFQYGLVWLFWLRVLLLDSALLLS